MPTRSTGPQNPQEALSWIKLAAREERYVMSKHLLQRMTTRSASLQDVVTALQLASRVEPYSEPPQHGGTCWRVHGKDPNGRRLAVGVEAFLDEQQRMVMLCTVIETKGGR